MQEFVKILLTFWNYGGSIPFATLGMVGSFFYIARWLFIHRENPLVLLHSRNEWVIRRLIEWRPKPYWLPGSVVFLSLGVLARIAISRNGAEEWAFRRPEIFLALHVAILLIPILTLWIFWDKHPSHVKSGVGRADGQWLDPSEDWGRTRKIDEKTTITDNAPVAALLAYRSPSKAAARTLIKKQKSKRNWTFIYLRWDILSGHIFILGSTGSGKTTTIYAHIMHSATCPWIYQDSKAELPWRPHFPNLPVFGLDMRGYETRSGVLNFLEEIKSKEDIDLVVDYIFPLRSNDNNLWVRQMARTMFRAILEARSWASLQEISRSLQTSQFDEFIGKLPPIWQKLMSEPKSSVPVVQDLVETLGRWETPRVAAITEGHSTVTIDDFLTKGGYIMNNEASDALRAPVQLFWAMVLGRLRNRPDNASSKILLLMDEFGDAGRIPDIETALLLLRSKGVGIIAGVQNFGILEKAYGRCLKAVLNGFGTKIVLGARLEDDYRKQLSGHVGKFTLRFKTAGSKQDQEREADLLPASEWGQYSNESAVFSRIHGWTYWLAYSIPTPATPLGSPIKDSGPWLGSDEEPPEASPLPDLKDSEVLQKIPAPIPFEDGEWGRPQDPDFLGN